MTANRREFLRAGATLSAAAAVPFYKLLPAAAATRGETLVVDPRGRGLTAWVPYENLHPLPVGGRVELGGVRIDAVKTAEVKALARRIFITTPTLAAVGQLDTLPVYDDIRGQLHALSKAA